MAGRVLIACLALLGAGTARGETEFSSGHYEFFESRVRPVLAENCFSCHGPEKQESGLRLDSRAAVLAGGQGGLAVKPGEPAASRLIGAVGYSGELRMPPTGKLAPSAIAALAEWVRMGLPWTPKGRSPERGTATKNIHWALGPIRTPPLPRVASPNWTQTPIDRFVLAKLQAHGLAPSPPADRRTLLRRAYFDLIGLPPSQEEVTSFLNDRSPDAFEKLVDRLLQRPEYGERWGRHWLDLARYADNKDYQDGGEPANPFAWTYRDYVIRALNEDVPYDQFVLHQLAADQLDLRPQMHWALAAMGLLTVGRRFNFNQHELIDDQIDVTIRGLMGLTLSCARCHDHKFDPLTTDDYYALYGVFKSSKEPDYLDKPRLEDPPPDPSRQFQNYQNALKKKALALRKKRRQLHEKIGHEMRAFAADYLEYLVQTVPEHRTQPQFSLQTKRTRLRGPTAYASGGIARWKQYIESRTDDDPVLGLWHQLIRVPKTELASRAPQMMARHASANHLVRQALEQSPPASMVDVARTYGQLLESIYERWQQTQKETPEATRLADPAAEQLRLVLYAQDSPAVMTEDEAFDVYLMSEYDQFVGLQGQLEKVFLENADVAPPRAMVMVDRAQAYQPYVFIRGNPQNKGRPVARRFPSVLSHVVDEKPFARGSGRLELAEAIVHPDNPLTARVIVNRVWHWHFGQGIVRTPSDFGVRGDHPSHPELLDYLAARFIQHGWSLKNLHRQIMGSATYQQSSMDRPRCQAVDPENRLLWRMNRRRQEFEAIRDGLLAVSGRLDTQRGGRPVHELTSPRRTVYLFIDRRRLPDVFQTFDFASTELSTPKRSETTVPQQALFLMNNPFMVEVTESLVEQLDEVTGEKHALPARVDWLYDRLFARQPTERERELARQFFQTFGQANGDRMPQERPSPPWRYGFGTYNRSAQRLESFTHLPHFTGTSWQGGTDWPDDELHYLRLTAGGGHVGMDRDHAAVRRWVAPADGVVEIRGQLVHGIDGEDCGDGVEAWIVSSRSGQLGQWVVERTSVATGIDGIEVTLGEKIDFVVECRENHYCDIFHWAPTIRIFDKAGQTDLVQDAATDFSLSRPRRPEVQPASPWQQYAQALLLSNEFVFID